MKIISEVLERQIEFSEENFCEWVIESPTFLTMLVEGFEKQVSGESGRLILCENGKELDISKNVELILNPFIVNLNDKKILNRVYSELTDISLLEGMYGLTIEILNAIKNYMLTIEQESPYILQYESNDLCVGELFRIFGAKIECDKNNMLENLCEYIKIMSKVFDKKLFVILNMRSFMETEQIVLMLEELLHYDIKILFIENVQRDCLKIGKRYIMDKDRCEI